MYQLCEQVIRISGAMCGDVTNTPQLLYIGEKSLKIRYRVCSRTRCKLVFKNVTSKVKYKFLLKVNNRKRYIDITLEEIGNYEIYISNKNSDFVQYDIVIDSRSY